MNNPAQFEPLVYFISILFVFGGLIAAVYLGAAVVTFWLRK